MLRTLWLRGSLRLLYPWALVATGALLAAGVAHLTWGALDWRVPVVLATALLLVASTRAVIRARPRRPAAAAALDRALGTDELLGAALDQVSLPPARRPGGARITLERAERLAGHLPPARPFRAVGRRHLIPPALAAAGALALLAPGAGRAPAATAPTAQPNVPTASLTAVQRRVRADSVQHARRPGDGLAAATRVDAAQSSRGDDVTEREARDADEGGTGRRDATANGTGGAGDAPGDGRVRPATGELAWAAQAIALSTSGPGTGARPLGPAARTPRALATEAAGAGSAARTTVVLPGLPPGLAARRYAATYFDRLAAR